MSDPSDPDRPPESLADIQHVLTRIAAGDAPTASELAGAPRLADWMPMRDPQNGLPVLFGQVTGHPRLGSGRWIRTSPLLAISPEAGWARTVSRFYVLGPAREKNHA
jgi:hypothetical protein